MSKKKLLLIHNVGREGIDIKGLDAIRDVTGMVRLARDWENQTYNRKWQDVTTDECEGYEYVMLIVLPDQNPEKLNKYLEIVSKESRKYKVLVYIPDVVGWQMNPFLPGNKLIYMEILSRTDFVLRVNVPESESYWKAVMRDKPSYFLERAYPVEVVKDVKKLNLQEADRIIRKFIPAIGKKFIFVGKSLKNINEERNVISTMYVAKKIQEKTGWGVVCFANNPLGANEKDNLYNDICGLRDVIELPVMRWIEYIKTLSTLNIQIGIYLDCLETRGQVALDCACTRIPLVCSSSVAGYKLYPHTWVSHSRNIDKALIFANKIVHEDLFRMKVISDAKKRVQDYSFDNTRKSLEKILGATL